MTLVIFMIGILMNLIGLQERGKGNKIRKISFSILLDSEFEGGDFSLQVDGEKRVIELGERNCIFFGSDTPHAVLPVTSGVRRSLVGWAQGPAFK